MSIGATYIPDDGSYFWLRLCHRRRDRSWPIAGLASRRSPHPRGGQVLDPSLSFILCPVRHPKVCSGPALDCLEGFGLSGGSSWAPFEPRVLLGCASVDESSMGRPRGEGDWGPSPKQAYSNFLQDKLTLTAYGPGRAVRAFPAGSCTAYVWQCRTVGLPNTHCACTRGHGCGFDGCGFHHARQGPAGPDRAAQFLGARRARGCFPAFPRGACGAPGAGPGWASPRAPRRLAPAPA